MISLFLSSFIWPCSVRLYQANMSPIPSSEASRKNIFSLRKLLVPMSARVVRGRSPVILPSIGRSCGTTYIITTETANIRNNRIITGYVIALVILFLSSSWLRRSVAIARNDVCISHVCSPLSTIAISCSWKKSGSFRIATFTASHPSTKKTRWSTHSLSFEAGSLSLSHFSAMRSVTHHSRRFATFS